MINIGAWYTYHFLCMEQPAVQIALIHMLVSFYLVWILAHNRTLSLAHTHPHTALLHSLYSTLHECATDVWLKTTSFLFFFFVSVRYRHWHKITRPRPMTENQLTFVFLQNDRDTHKTSTTEDFQFVTQERNQSNGFPFHSTQIFNARRWWWLF